MKPLIVITGPTASGKTTLGIQLAKMIEGEIICADSRTVYRGMSIGTAKPTAKEQASVSHWGLDLVNPDERFTLYDFEQYAYAKIDEIRARGRVPMLVGGSGLYISAVIYRYDLTNKKCMQLGNNTVLIGVDLSRETLNNRSVQRAEQMIDDGLIDEVINLRRRYGDVMPLRRNAYGVVRDALIEVGGDANKLDRQKLVQALALADRHLVKKQLTWWRSPHRRNDIWWQTPAELNRFMAEHGVASAKKIAGDLRAAYKNYKSNSRALDN